MDDIQIDCALPLGDDFYEKIEAPKFVDLTAPDHHRSSNEDRYWFCLRVGCDQKHEEEMDSEAIYKNFVLRVMAARSPNVRLRKALYGKDSSANLKCPRTVPAKSSKSRVSRLALISSISQKMVDGKVKGRAVPKQVGTPKGKAKQSSVLAKSLTTPRNKKRLSNPGTFRSVRNPKPTAIAVPKNRIVAKALVFHSPKKAVRTKTSIELSTRMRTLCAGMKKLEITSGKKHLSICNKSMPFDASRKQFRGREVKSRVYDSLRSQNCRAKEAKSSKSLKTKDNQKDLLISCGPAPCEENENDSSDMEVEGKSRNGSLEVCSTSGTSRSNKSNEHEECLTTLKVENEVKSISETSRSDTTSNCGERNGGDDSVPHFPAPSGEGSKSNEGGDSKGQIKSSPEKGITPEVIESEVMNNCDNKENASSSDDSVPHFPAPSGEGSKTNEGGDSKGQIKSSPEKGITPEVIESEVMNNCDNKENASSSDDSVPHFPAPSGEDSKTCEGGDSEGQIKSSPEKGITPEVIESDEKENASDDKENEGEVMNNCDNKENASSSDDNRKLDLNSSQKKKTLGKHENSRSIRTVSKGMCKTSKANSIAAITCAEGVNYRKPKLTNPKPFRLRTDERRILKEANLEKKLHHDEPLKEIKKIAKCPGGNLQRRHQSAVVQKNEKCMEQIEYASDVQGSEMELDKTTEKDQPQRTGTSCSQTPTGAVERKQSTTPQRCTLSRQKKTKLAASDKEFSLDREAKRSEGSLKKTKSPYMKQLARTRGTESSRKKTISRMTPGQLGVIKESSPTILRTKVVAKPMDNGASHAIKALTSRASLMGRKPTTPKEPHFHNVHVPKSCIRRVA